MADPNAPEFTPEAATTFLTEHGVDPKSLEGVAPEALKAQYDSAQLIASKASERALAKATEDAKAAVPGEYKFVAGKDKDGKEIAPDATIAKDVTEFAKAHGLKAEAAQAAYDAVAKIGKTAVEQLAEQVSQLHRDWAQTAEKDKEFGGEKFAENRATMKAALDQLGTPELVKLLSGTDPNGTGLENHPEVMRLLFRAGKLVQQGKTVQGDRSAGQPADARTMFPQSPQLNA